MNETHEAPGAPPEPARNSPSEALLRRLSDQVNDLETALERHRRRAALERGAWAIALAAAFTVPQVLQRTPRIWAVHLNGKPVVAMDNRTSLERVFQAFKGRHAGASVLEDAALRPSRPGELPVTDAASAARALEEAVETHADRGVVYVNGQPAVALPDAAEAAEVLADLKEHARGKLQRVEAEPYFKEQVEIRAEPAPRSLWADAAGARAALLGRGGATTHRVRSGDTGYVIARRAGLTLEELQRLNPGVNLSRLRLDQALAVGGKPAAPIEGLTVVATGEVVETSIKPFGTDTTPRPLMWTGKRIRARKGIPGKERVQYRVTLENGEPVSREVLNRTLIRAPQDELIAVGTKPRRG